MLALLLFDGLPDIKFGIVTIDAEGGVGKVSRTAVGTHGGNVGGLKDDLGMYPGIGGRGRCSGSGSGSLVTPLISLRAIADTDATKQTHIKTAINARIV